MGLGFPRGRSAPGTVDRLHILGAIHGAFGPDPPLSSWPHAGRPPLGLGVVRDQYIPQARAQAPRRSAWCPGRCAVRGTPPVQFCRVRQCRGARARRSRQPPDLGRQHPTGTSPGVVCTGAKAPGSPNSSVGGSSIPSLPGFGGSDPLDWHDVSMEILANQVMAVIAHVEAGPLVVLGPFDGGAAVARPSSPTTTRARTLGLIYPRTV